jgi:multidrug efflux pump subunit AcrB
LLGTKKNASVFGAITIGLLVASMAFVAFKWVKVKMLPFDNKEEFQVLIDYEPRTTLAQSMSQTELLAKLLLQNPNVEKIQIFGGEAAPFSFSGMVKHSFLRNLDSMNDLQIILKNKNDRKVSSHEIIESLRGEIKTFGETHHAVTKVLEIPPGPPVMATMVAEVYGPTASERKKVAEEIYQIFKEEPSVVDLDTSLRNGRPKMVYPIDFDKSGLFGIKTSALAYTGSILFSESPLVSLATAKEPEEVSISLSIKQNVRSSKSPFQNQNIMSMESGVVSSERVLGTPYLEEDSQLCDERTFWRRRSASVWNVKTGTKNSV